MVPSGQLLLDDPRESLGPEDVLATLAELASLAPLGSLGPLGSLAALFEDAADAPPEACAIDMVVNAGIV